MIPIDYETPPPIDVPGIMVRQRGFFLCVVLMMALSAMHFIVPSPLVFPVTVACAGALIVGLFFVFLLAMKVYSMKASLLLGLFMLVPLIGLVVVLIVNEKATRLLRAHHSAIGLFGRKL